MSTFPTIAISPTSSIENEADLINQLFEAGLHRYHIKKSDATEQSIATILEGVSHKYLGQITLHSHFHLVLAYGVGGIHYSSAHRTSLGADYVSKVKLYQGFGIKVSTDISQNDFAPADYTISSKDMETNVNHDSIYFLTESMNFVGIKRTALDLSHILIDESIITIVNKIIQAKQQ